MQRDHQAGFADQGLFAPSSDDAGWWGRAINGATNFAPLAPSLPHRSSG